MWMEEGRGDRRQWSALGSGMENYQTLDFVSVRQKQ